MFVNFFTFILYFLYERYSKFLYILWQLKKTGLNFFFTALPETGQGEGDISANGIKKHQMAFKVRSKKAIQVLPCPLEYTFLKPWATTEKIWPSWGYHTVRKPKRQEETTSSTFQLTGPTKPNLQAFPAQPPDMWVKRPTNDSGPHPGVSSNYPSFASSDPRYHEPEISHLCCTLSKFLTQRIQGDFKAVVILFHKILVWFVMHQEIISVFWMHLNSIF